MKKAKELLDKYNDGSATPEERAIVESWYLQYKTPSSDLTAQDLLEEHRIGLERLHKSLNIKKNIQHRTWISIAASLLCAVGISWFIFDGEDSIANESSITSNLLPETNAVILTLANGRKITVSESNVGEIVADKGVKIHQTERGELVYSVVDGGEASLGSAYNTMEIPIGNQYKLVLPDGSSVLLGAGSMLRYPVRFSENERKVELIGQAHFEIVSMQTSKKSGAAKVPFIVVAGNQEVEVLGTQFNVSAYPDDKFIETALLEGAVKVSIKGSGKGQLLQPGQMAVNDLSGAIPKINDIDISDLKAWKEGYFIFNNENIKDIMTKLSRWYGFTVEYQGEMSDIAFQGNYIRTREVKNLLAMMEMAKHVMFDIVDRKNERRIIVKRKN